MAKNREPPVGSKIEIVIPPKGSFFKKSSSGPSQLPKTQKVPKAQVVSELKALGTGWDDETEALLAIPGELFRNSGEGTIYFSKEKEFGISDIALGLAYGRVGKPKTEYGIAIHDTAGNTYFILADMKRRIIVKERLSGLHDQPSEKDWSVVKRAISAAAALASSTTPGDNRIAVFDGNPRLVAPAAP